MVLSYFSMDVPASALLQACRHTETYGAFMIALAVGLHERGLHTAFYTDPDDYPKPLEKHCYRLADERGLQVQRAVGVAQALSMITPTRIGLVFYGTPEGEGHISPLTGRAGNHLLLPLAPSERMAIPEFERRWQEPEILRQLVLVSKEAI